MRVILYLLAAMTAATPAAAQQAEPAPWVCVPTRQYGWMCGRGVEAPTPRQLPPALPTEEPPAGYPLTREAAPQASTREVAGEVTTEAVQAAEDQKKTSTVPPASPAPSPSVVREQRQPTAPQTTATSPAYGIQLAATRSPEALDVFIEQHGLESLDTYQRRWRDEEGVWYVLLWGRFPTVGDARRGLPSLPDELQYAGAWARRVDTLSRKRPSVPIAPGSPVFGIQLAATHDSEDLDKFVGAHGLESTNTYRRQWADDAGVWYVLLWGRFPTLGDARRALPALSDELESAGAWVRRVDQLEAYEP